MLENVEGVGDGGVGVELSRVEVPVGDSQLLLNGVKASSNRSICSIFVFSISLTQGVHEEGDEVIVEELGFDFVEVLEELNVLLLESVEGPEESSVPLEDPCLVQVLVRRPVGKVDFLQLTVVLVVQFELLWNSGDDGWGGRALSKHLQLLELGVGHLGERFHMSQVFWVWNLLESIDLWIEVFIVIQIQWLEFLATCLLLIKAPRSFIKFIKEEEDINFFRDCLEI